MRPLVSSYIKAFQSTLPVWGATVHPTPPRLQARISIHAPRVGSDKRFRNRICPYFRISIHAPRVGSDGKLHRRRNNRMISIHAPRVGSDRVYRCTVIKRNIFQSTLPVWGATRKDRRCPFVFGISIHAPRVGSDHYSPRPIYHAHYFNPRSPCGERPMVASCAEAMLTFQSTLPVWGATR